MGHTASVNRQRRATVERSYAEVSSRERYTPARMQALYLSHGRPDTAFLSNQDGSLPVGIPEVQQTCAVKTYVNLKKTSLTLQRLSIYSQQYALKFQFDAAKPCRVCIYLVTAETIDADTGCSSFALIHEDKSPVLTQYFHSGLGQSFDMKGSNNEENTFQRQQHVEHSLSFLDLSVYDPDELVYTVNTTQFPLIIALEVLIDGKSPQSQSTFCTFFRNGDDSLDVKVLKQKVVVDGVMYELQEIYGIDGLVTAAPRIEQNSVTSNEQAEAFKDEVGILEGVECVICLCEPRNTTVLPCRHMCLCSQCAEALRKSSNMCPVCRTRVEGFMQISQIEV
ncbi:hypothetical protein PsorP6_008470 [Peronosclerospora sorghi]|uniref:Uncharacterized protein n=1 Tax=Peronosclerospora sorghi TaxID=230839 RepID=A0ACC0W8L1_9STRA|nr:hypothetical protein PsorP6_008470 [Peronosclerospora sorghi]